MATSRRIERYILYSDQVLFSQKMAGCSVYEAYARTTRDIRAKYGMKTVVFMEVGSFFELYGVPNPISNELSVDDLRHVCETILEIQVTKKNKNIPESNDKNPFMAGFPNYMLDKYVDLVIAQGYTVVIMEQQRTKLTTKTPQFYRTVSRIVSPGTFISGVDGNNKIVNMDEDESGRHLMAFRFETGRINGQRVVTFGMACCDVSTGDLFTYEPAVNRDANDIKLIKEDIVRILSVYRPCEVVIFGSLQDAHENHAVVNVIELNATRNALIHDKMGAAFSGSMDVYTKSDYQNALIRKVWPLACESLMTPLEVLDLDSKPLAASSLCALLQFIYEHNDALVKNIKRPVCTHDSANKTVNLNHNSAAQLDILSSYRGGTSSSASSSSGFIGMFNKCSTIMGKRLFRKRLLCPTYDVSELQRRYNAVDGHIKNGNNTWDIILKKLKGVQDLDRLVRKLSLSNILHHELWNLAQGVHAALECLQLADGNQTAHNEDQLKAFEFCSDVFQKIRNPADIVGTTNNNNVAVNIFNPGVSAHIDSLEHEANEALSKLQHIVRVCNHHAANQEFYKLDSNDRDGYFISVTQKRHADCLKAAAAAAAETAASPHSSTPIILIKDLEKIPGNTSSTGLRLTHTLIQKLNHIINSSAASVSEAIRDIWAKFTKRWCDEFVNCCRWVADRVAVLDWECTCAMLAVKHSWIRPTLINSLDAAVQQENNDVEQGACVSAIDLRHPIIECVLQNQQYIPNDVALGHYSATASADHVLDGVQGTKRTTRQHTSKGMLLYGINSSGKSSYMKAIGIAVVMAQAGMFVPATKFFLKPFKAIFTRIVSSDNLYLGRSTFTNEIMELRNIIKCADEYALVIGDELCSGTESISAVSIVGAGIERLSEAKSCFVFATHLHELTNLNIITHLNSLKVCHLDVHYDTQLDTIVYNRKIQDGPGDALYGLEVCKSLDLDPLFMKTAAAIRKKILGMPDSLVNTKTSRYCSQLFMDACELCGKNMASETHHIVPQRMADEKGIVLGLYHKNRKFNLVCLCSTCHDTMHTEQHTSSPHVNAKTNFKSAAKLRKTQTLKGICIVASNE